MISEIKSDICKEKLYISSLLNDIGRLLYPQLLLDSVREGDEQTLSASLYANECIIDKEVLYTDNGVIISTVPSDASLRLAESEFNRFYMRALAIQAIDSGKSLRVYCAKPICEREKEREMVGNMLNPHTVLDRLRVSMGVSTAFGLPAGYQSALSATIA